MAHPDRVGVWKGDDNSDFGVPPIFFGNELVDLAANVLSRLGNEREQFSANFVFQFAQCSAPHCAKMEQLQSKRSSDDYHHTNVAHFYKIWRRHIES